MQDFKRDVMLQLAEIKKVDYDAATVISETIIESLKQLEQPKKDRKFFGVNSTLYSDIGECLSDTDRHTIFKKRRFFIFWDDENSRSKYLVLRW